MRPEQIKEGDYFLIEERADMPNFLRSQNIAGSMARVIKLPQGKTRLVEMESYVEGERGQQTFTFAISLEILQQLKNLGLPS